MTDDLEVVGAFLWRQLGHRPATSNQAEGALSYELHLFKPSEARIVLDALISRGLFHREGDQLTGVPDLLGIDRPLGYHPPESFLKDLPRGVSLPLLPRLLEFISTGLSEVEQSRVPEEVAEVAKHLGVSRESAALLVGWKKGRRDPTLIEECARSISQSVPAK